MTYGICKKTNFAKVKTSKETAKKALVKAANLATIAKVTNSFHCNKQDK